MNPEEIPKLRRVTVPTQSGSDALVTSLAALVDRSVMRTVTFVVEKRILPRPADLDRLRDSIQVMLDIDLFNAPGKFFRFVPELESAQATRRAVPNTYYGRRIAGGTVQRCKLESSYRHYPQLPPPNAFDRVRDSIQFEHWIHEPGAAKGSVIVLHGFGMGWPVIDAVALSASSWFELGFDVILLTLPDHGQRRTSGASFSGQSFTVPHAVHLAAAVRRAIHEIFELKRWLRSQSDRPVGLVGMSLGGYLASLCAGLSEDFDFLIPVVPPACMGDLAWRVYRNTAFQKAGHDETLTEENMRAAFYIHSPLAHLRKIPKERILIAAGAGDRIVPPEHPSALWEHWDRPNIHWFRGSHVASVANRPLMRVVRQHLKTLEIL